MMTVVLCEDLDRPDFRLFHIRPSVTAVGGTDSIPEVAVSAFFSGGGLSGIVGWGLSQMTLYLTYLVSFHGQNIKIRPFPNISALYLMEYMRAYSTRR